MIRAVIFDFNGVLVDDEPVHFALFREILAEEGIDLTEERYYGELLGYDDRGSFEVALRAAGHATGRARVDELIARKAMRYKTLAEGGLRIFPGAAGSVVALAERWPVAVCSGALRPEIEFALERMKVRESVAVIVSAEDTTRGKPDPEGYLLALERLRSPQNAAFGTLDPRECLVVEDSQAGLVSARAAGMRTLGVTHTYPVATLKDAGAQHVIEGLAQLTADWVEAIYGNGSEDPQR